MVRPVNRTEGRAMNNLPKTAREWLALSTAYAITALLFVEALYMGGVRL